MLGTLNDFSFGVRVHFMTARDESLEDIARTGQNADHAAGRGAADRPDARDLRGHVIADPSIGSVACCRRGVAGNRAAAAGTVPQADGEAQASL